jgi:hypothetical protein
MALKADSWYNIGINERIRKKMTVVEKVQLEQTTLQEKLNAHVLSFMPSAEHISYKHISKEGLFQLKKVMLHLI